MLLAELNIRHTRRHQPTRRVAISDTYLPTSGSVFGAVLLGAVVAEHLPLLDEEQRELLPRLLHEARNGLSVPRIAMRYRLQTDLHGLDRSRHRIVRESVRTILELDRHGRPDPQVVGAVMAAAALPPTARSVALRAIDAAMRRPGVLPEGLEVRRLLEGVPGMRPYAPGEGPESEEWARAGRSGGAAGGESDGAQWFGIPADRRWAMEVLGLRAGTSLERTDVQARFRRLVRLAHPDHGAARDGAAERMSELAEARELLLDVIASGDRAHRG